MGSAIQAERARLRGVNPEIFLMRRFAVLLVFGLIHLVFISNVDILTLYAICGLLLIPLLRLPAAALALIGVALIYLPWDLYRGAGLPAEPALRAHVAA